MLNVKLNFLYWLRKQNVKSKTGEKIKLSDINLIKKDNKFLTKTNNLIQDILILKNCIIEEHKNYVIYVTNIQYNF